MMIVQLCFSTVLQSFKSYPFSFILAAGFILISYRFLRVKYSHPLRPFPGPFLGAITDFYQVYLFATKRGHVKLFSLHGRHGSSTQLWVT